MATLKDHVAMSIATLPRALSLLLVAWACSAPRADIAPQPFSSAVAAALYFSLRPTIKTESGPVQAIVNVPASLGIDERVLRTELSSVLTITALLRSDSFYGGSELVALAPDSYYVAIDVRPSDMPEAGDSIFSVANESCRGWPCHSGMDVVVLRRDRGFVATQTVSWWIE